MKYAEISMNDCLWGSDHFPYGYSETEDTTIINLKSRPHPCRCPHCGSESNKRSATYERVLQDVPRKGKTVLLNVRAYKYRCENPECRVVTFNEELPFAHGIQRRTDALNELILAVSLYLSAEGASRVLRMLGVRISDDAIRKLWSNVVIEDRPNVTEVGIDDVAMRKGHTYSTVIYDKLDGAMLALLNGRDGQELREWLEQHKKIERVSRDRATAYAAAITEVLPSCVQVADRYHLFANLSACLRDYIMDQLPGRIFLKDGQVVDLPEDTIKRVYKEKRVDVTGLSYDTSMPVDENGTPIEIDAQGHQTNRAQNARNAESRQRKKKLVQQVQELRAQGINQHQTALKLGISDGTVKKYSAMTQQEINALDAPARRAPRKRKGEECIPIMYKMMADGHDDITIISYLRSRGYKYALGTLHSRMRAISRNHFPERRVCSHPNQLLVNEEADLPDGVVSILRSELFYALMTVDERKMGKRAMVISVLPQIAERYQAVTEIQQIAHDFRNVIFGGEPGALDSFIRTYEDSPVSRFCNGLKRDIHAVFKAITLSTNSGWVEGSNNKFKLIKRTMYGRAGHKRLEHKCRMIFAVRSGGVKISDLICYNHRARPSSVSQSSV